MLRPLIVKANKVPPVERQYGAPVRVCESQHSLIGGLPVGLSGLVSRQYIVAEKSQGNDDLT
jgi:hypothetical protein